MNSSVVAAVAAANSPVKRVKVGMISLGCAKNLVDAEVMLGSVLQRGMEITSRAEDADVLVINTCAFIDSAKEESIEAILEAHQQRGLNKRPNQKLIVSGCMSQRFARELHNELPEVDAFVGLDQVSQLGEIVDQILRKRPTSNAQRPTLNHPASRMVIEPRLDHEHEHEGRIPGCHRAIPA
jgi:ribosomal protein S12 methylthiotransferase